MKKPRIRACAREDSRLLSAATILLVFSGILGLVLSPQLSRMTYSLIAALGTKRIPPLPPLSSIFLIAAGALVFLSRRRRSLGLASAIALLVSMLLFYSRFDACLFPIIASVLTVLSALGWRSNIVCGFLPEKLKLPLMNLLSAAITVFCAPEVLRSLELGVNMAGLQPLVIYIYAFTALLPFAGLLLFNLGMGPQYAEGPGPARNIRSVPKGGALFAAAACILLAGSLAGLLITLTSGYDVYALLLALLLFAAGILIVSGRGGEKRFLAATVCLALCAAASIFRPASYARFGLWSYSLPLLMMFISSVGVLRNVSPKVLSKLTRAPILNLLAAALLLANIAFGTANTLERNDAAAEARDAAYMKAATVAGGAASSANYYANVLEEAMAQYNGAEDNFYAILELTAPHISEESAEAVTADIKEAAAGVKAAAKSAARAVKPFEEASSSFEAVISELSVEAAAEFADIANIPKKPTVPSTSIAPALSPPAEMPSPEDIESGLLDPADAANDAMYAVYSAETSALIAAGNAESAYAEAVLAITGAETAAEGAAVTAEETIVSWYMLLISLLPAAGLVLINLSLEGRVLESKGIFAALRVFCRRIFRWFYRDVGGKLQTLARIQGVICASVACLSALTAAVGLCGFLVTYFFTGSVDSYPFILAAGVAGIISSFILALPSWFLYAYGQITADLREVKRSKNPDDLPEL